MFTQVPILRRYGYLFSPLPLGPLPVRPLTRLAPYYTMLACQSLSQRRQSVTCSPPYRGTYSYTCRQINLYRMFFADFPVNSQPILMKFCKDYFRVTRRLP